MRRRSTQGYGRTRVTVATELRHINAASTTLIAYPPIKAQSFAQWRSG